MYLIPLVSRLLAFPPPVTQTHTLVPSLGRFEVYSSSSCSSVWPFVSCSPFIILPLFPFPLSLPRGVRLSHSLIPLPPTRSLPAFSFRSHTSSQHLLCFFSCCFCFRGRRPFLVPSRKIITASAIFLNPRSCLTVLGQSPVPSLHFRSIFSRSSTHALQLNKVRWTSIRV